MTFSSSNKNNFFLEIPSRVVVKFFEATILLKVTIHGHPHIKPSWNTFRQHTKLSELMMK